MSLHHGIPICPTFHTTCFVRPFGKNPPGSSIAIAIAAAASIFRVCDGSANSCTLPTSMLKLFHKTCQVSFWPSVRKFFPVFVVSKRQRRSSAVSRERFPKPNQTTMAGGSAGSAAGRASILICFCSAVWWDLLATVQYSMPHRGNFFKEMFRKLFLELGKKIERDRSNAIESNVGGWVGVGYLI